MAIEASGIPSLALGLYVAIRGRKTNVPAWLDWFSLIGVLVGVSMSLKDFGGFTTLTQYFELALAIGFLYGVYRLAKDKIDGYFGFMMMNVANAALMGVQEMWLLMVQQILSLGFVVAAYRVKAKKQKTW